MLASGNFLSQRNGNAPAAQEELSFLIRTVPSVLESHQIGLPKEVHGLYHRSGFAPCPKDHSVLTSTLL